MITDMGTTKDHINIKVNQLSSDILVSRNNLQVYVTYTSGDIEKFNIDGKNLTSVGKASICPTIISQRFSSNENLIYYSCGTSGVVVLDNQSLQILQKQLNFSYFTQIINNKLYSSFQRGLYIYSIQGNQQIEFYQKIENDQIGESQYFAISPDLKFLFQGNSIHFQVTDISNPSTPQVVTNDILKGGYGIKHIVLHPNKKIVFVPTTWAQIVAIDYSKYEGKSYPVQFSYDGIYIDETNSKKNDLWISADGNYLFNSQVGQGIIVLDCTDITNIFVYQKLDIFGTLQRIFLIPDQLNFLYTSTSKELLIYQRSYPQDVEINLFTRGHSIKWKGENTKEQWPWEQLFTHNYSRFYVCHGVDGLILYDSTKLPLLIKLKSYVDPEIQGLSYVFTVKPLIGNENILLIGNYQNHGFFILNLTNYQTPIVLYHMKIPNNGIVYHLLTFTTNPHKIVISTKRSIYIMDIKDQTKPFIQSNFIDNYKSLDQDGLFISLSQEEKYIFGVDNTLGKIFTAKISDDFSSISVVSNLKINAPRQVIQSKKHGQKVYVLSASDGLLIYDIGNNYTEFNKISELKLEGNMLSMGVYENDNVIFIASTIKSTMMTVDIANITNPKLLHVLKTPAEYSFIINYYKIPNIGNFLIINTFNGIRVMPSKLEIKTNIEFYQIKENQLSPVKQQKGIITEFFVGDVFQIQVQNLVNPRQKNIISFSYYNPEQPSELFPSKENMKFDITNKIIHVTASKSIAGLNTVVVQINNIISVSDIEKEVIHQIGGDQVQEKKEAQIVYEVAQEFGYIDAEGYASKKFSIDENLVLASDQNNMQRYAKKLHQFMKKKVNQVPINFVISPSLKFNPNRNDPQQSLKRIIETYARSLEIQISINRAFGVFFQQQFQGLVSSYSDDQSQVTLNGNTDVINSQISSLKLEIVDKANQNQIELKVQINDGLNEKFEKTFKFQELTFIKTNLGVQVFNPLQKQFNQQYNDGGVYVTEQFTFQFSGNTFKDDDKLKYSLFVQENNKRIKITNSVSVDQCQYSFDDALRTLKGECKQGKFGGKATIVVTASDGFSSNEDSFQIKYNKIPVLTIIYYIGLFGSGLLTFIGYRGFFYGMLCKSKYRNGDYFIMEGEEFLIQIILNKDEMKAGQILFAQFLKFIKINQIDFNEIFIDKNQEKLLFNKLRIIELLKAINPELNLEGYANSNSFNYVIFKSLACQHLIKQKQYGKERELFKKLMQFPLRETRLHKDRWYELYTEILPVQVVDWQSCTPSVSFKTDIIFQTMNLILKNKQYSKVPDKMTSLYIFDNINTGKKYKIEENELYQVLYDQSIEFPDYNLNLILNMIYVYAIGLTPVSWWSLKFTRGQCITQSTQKIKIARALRKRNNILNPILACFNLDYLDIPFSQNMPLPSWCGYKFHHNVIEIFGKIPENVSHQERKKNYVIRIDDINNLTVREFHLKQVDRIEECSQQLLMKNMEIDPSLLEQDELEIKDSERKQEKKYTQNNCYSQKKLSNIMRAATLKKIQKTLQQNDLSQQRLRKTTVNQELESQDVSIQMEQDNLSNDISGRIYQCNIDVQSEREIEEEYKQGESYQNINFANRSINRSYDNSILSPFYHKQEKQDKYKLQNTVQPISSNGTIASSADIL